jgi:hypothetical protein
VSDLAKSIVRSKKASGNNSDQLILDKVYGRGRVKRDPGVESVEESNKTDGKGMSFDLMQNLQKMT